MSGSDGKLFRDYTAGAPTETACDMLYLQTHLASPKADVVGEISVGDTLSIILEFVNNELVANAVWKNRVAGGIASPKVIRLIACIQNGTNYTALVTAKDGAQVAIKVSPIKE
ncbi:hypothetical protein BR1R3_47780 [Pseudomonas atacamensis]|uniref:hypothetical protein n=1 Tax=Pseudomonas atacamensis TaxID=2565368 RepID=UPI0022BBF534|nr:hypothetical protein [Pseudomonas atacamensis]GLH22036.1 hypothetical protein BR1R3_47780 [Pseudomonas atacamensis]